MVIDCLIMLLSTDWFLPFWPEVGLDLEIAVRAVMQEGCREIVRAVMVKKSADDEGSFDYIDYSEECMLEARSMLIELVEKLDVRSVVSPLLDEQTDSAQDQTGTAMMLRLLTHELIDGVSGAAGGVPEFAVRVAAMEASVSYDIEPDGFWEISTKSASGWDQYLQSLLVETPDALSMHLYPAVQERRLRALWGRLSERLTVRERQDLLSWYRAMAKSRGFPWDPVPSYIS
jgi:hypothetical protein